MFTLGVTATCSIAFYAITVGTDVLERDTAGASDETRADLLREALDAFLTSPLIGVGAAEMLRAHNILLTALAFGGIGAGLIVLYLLSKLVLSIRSAANKYSYVAIALVVALSFQTFVYTPEVWFLSGITLFGAPIGRQSASNSTPVERQASVRSLVRLQ